MACVCWGCRKLSVGESGIFSLYFLFPPTLLFFNVDICIACMYCKMPNMEQSWVSELPKNGSYSRELRCGCWELSLEPLEVLLITEPLCLSVTHSLHIYMHTHTPYFLKFHLEFIVYLILFLLSVLFNPLKFCILAPVLVHFKFK